MTQKIFKKGNHLEDFCPSGAQFPKFVQLFGELDILYGETWITNGWKRSQICPAKFRSNSRQILIRSGRRWRKIPRTGDHEMITPILGEIRHSTRRHGSDRRLGMEEEEVVHLVFGKKGERFCLLKKKRKHPTGLHSQPAQKMGWRIMQFRPDA